MTGGDTGALGRLPMLAPPLAALLYPFALEGFCTSVARIAEVASILSWLSAAASLALAFAMPLIAMFAAMSFSEIGRPTVAQLRAKRTALLALAAPTLFVFVGALLTMLHEPVPDTWFWVACWAIALALRLPRLLCAGPHGLHPVSMPGHVQSFRMSAFRGKADLRHSAGNEVHIEVSHCFQASSLGDTPQGEISPLGLRKNAVTRPCS